MTDKDVADTTPAAQKQPTDSAALRRRRALIGGVVAVLVLAGVIFGVSALSDPQERPAEEVVQLTPAEESDLKYSEALTALQSGETTEAVALLETAVKLDPNNELAVKKLAEIQAQQSEEQGGGTSGTDTTEPEEPAAEVSPFLKPVKNLKVLLPEGAEGYVLGTPTGNKTDVAVSGDPTDIEALASRCVWTVHDRKTPSSAKRFVTDVSKELYTSDPESMDVDGARAYFGTDGMRFATVVYVRGRYVFEAVLTTLAGSPEQLFDEAVAAAEAFPDEL